LVLATAQDSDSDEIYGRGMDFDDGRRLAQERLHILDAMATVIDRRGEFLALVADSESSDEAGRRLQAEWDLTEVQAEAALNLQARRFAGVERARILAERDELRRRAAGEL
jgi:DNA gyrase subunit A